MFFTRLGIQFNHQYFSFFVIYKVFYQRILTGEEFNFYSITINLLPHILCRIRFKNFLYIQQEINCWQCFLPNTITKWNYLMSEWEKKLWSVDCINNIKWSNKNHISSSAWWKSFYLFIFFLLLYRLETILFNGLKIAEAIRA